MSNAHFIRLGSLTELPQNLTPLGGGFYCQGHIIWELRGAEDEEGGYVLTRKREERAVDLRTKAAEHLDSCSDFAVEKTATRCPSCLWVGQAVHLVKQGQVFSAIVVELPPDGFTDVNVQDELGDVQQVPLDMVVTDLPAQMQESEVCACCECLCHGNSKQDQVKRGPVEGMNPTLEPSSKDMEARASLNELESAIHRAWRIRAASGAHPAHSMLWDRYVIPRKRFSPRYMDGTFTFDPDEREVYMVEGMSKADPEYDRLYGVPRPSLPYPNARSGPEWTLNDRIRLRPYNGGKPIFVSPIELERNFDVAPEETVPSSPTPSLKLEPKQNLDLTQDVKSDQVSTLAPTAPELQKGDKTRVSGPRRRR